MTPEERASKAMAECIAKNKGKNMAFYLAQAIREAVAEERERCARAAYEWGERAQSRYAQAELRLLSDHLGRDLG